MKTGLCILALLGFFWASQTPGDAVVDTTVAQLVSLGVAPEPARLVAERWVHQNHEPDAMLQTLRKASEAGAPMDLMVNKTLEGLAKGVSKPRLLSVLDVWGGNLAQAVRRSTSVREKLDARGISEQETILRLSFLQHQEQDDAWLQRLEEEAQKNQMGLATFLRIGAAVERLNRALAVGEAEAGELGMLWIRKNVPVGDIGKIIRAMEVGYPDVAVPTRIVKEQIEQGRSPEEVISSLAAERERYAKSRIEISPRSSARVPEAKGTKPPQEPPQSGAREPEVKKDKDLETVPKYGIEEPAEKIGNRGPGGPDTMVGPAGN